MKASLASLVAVVTIIAGLLTGGCQVAPAVQPQSTVPSAIALTTWTPEPTLRPTETPTATFTPAPPPTFAPTPTEAPKPPSTAVENSMEIRDTQVEFASKTFLVHMDFLDPNLINIMKLQSVRLNDDRTAEAKAVVAAMDPEGKFKDVKLETPRELIARAIFASLFYADFRGWENSKSSDTNRAIADIKYPAGYYPQPDSKQSRAEQMTKAFQFFKTHWQDRTIYVGGEGGKRLDIPVASVKNVRFAITEGAGPEKNVNVASAGNCGFAWDGKTLTVYGTMGYGGLKKLHGGVIPESESPDGALAQSLFGIAFTNPLGQMADSLMYANYRTFPFQAISQMNNRHAQTDVFIFFSLAHTPASGYWLDWPDHEGETLPPLNLYPSDFIKYYQFRRYFAPFKLTFTDPKLNPKP